MITLEPKAYLFLLKIIINKNLIGERFAWVLARQARKERKLLAQRENLLVPDDRMGVFSSPECENRQLDQPLFPFVAMQPLTAHVLLHGYGFNSFEVPIMWKFKMLQMEALKICNQYLHEYSIYLCL